MPTTDNSPINQEIYLRTGGRRKNDEFFRLLVETMNEGVVVTNNEGYILYVNFKFSEIIGRSLEALIGQKITAYVDDSNKKILKKGFEICQKNQRATLEIIWNKDNDEKIITCVSSRMIEDTCPENNLYFAIITDITESKKVQKELIRSEQKYNTVVENSLAGLYIEQNGKIVYSNPHFADILGYKSTELMGKKTQELIQNEKYCQVDEIQTNTKNGNVIWIICNCIQIQYRGTPAVLGNIMEITQQKELEKHQRISKLQLHIMASKLFDAQENERKRIAAELHDGIGQYLTAIKFKLEKVIQDSEVNRLQSDSLRSLIPLLKSATEETRRIAMGLRPSILDDLGLKATVNWFCREYQSVYPSIKLEPHIVVPESKLTEKLKTVIYRILQESLNNVAKYSGATHVYIHLKVIENKIELLIEDNGVGFFFG